VQSRETEAEIISLLLYQTRKNTWEQICHYIFLFFGKLVIFTKRKSQGSQKSFLQWKLEKVVLTGGHLYTQAPNFKIKMLEKKMSKLYNKRFDEI